VDGGRRLVGGRLGEEALLRGATVARAGAVWEANGGRCLVVGGLGKEGLLRSATFTRAGAEDERKRARRGRWAQRTSASARGEEEEEGEGERRCYEQRPTRHGYCRCFWKGAWSVGVGVVGAPLGRDGGLVLDRRRRGSGGSETSSWEREHT
jgi:hypothetical protein